MRPTSTFAHVAGGVLVIHGTLGLAITGLASTPAAQDRLLGVGISPILNVVHVTLGLALVTTAALDDRWGRNATLVAAAALATLGLLGLAAPPGGGVLGSANGATTASHLVLAVWAAFACLQASRPRIAPADGHRTTKAVQR